MSADYKIIRIGLIEDDDNKLISIKANIKEGFEDAKPDKIQMYSNIQLIPIDLKIKDNRDAVLVVLSDMISKGEMDAVFIDYRLSTYANTTLNGVKIAEFIKERYEFFPYYLMTAYEDALYRDELFPANRVLDTSRYLDDPTERADVHAKIIQDVKYHRTNIENWESELLSLLETKNPNQHQRERVLYLDRQIESYLFTKTRMTEQQRSDNSISKLEKIATEIDELLRKIDNHE